MNLQDDIAKEDTAQETTDPRMKTFFTSVSPLVLKTFGVKQKNQRFILEIIARQFETDHSYTEKQVNEILMPIYRDYIGIRRALVDYGFLRRTADGAEYWVK